VSGGNSLISEELILSCFQQSAAILTEGEKLRESFVEREIKLDVDMELDSFFRCFLEKESGFGVYSEESLGVDPLKETCWIVDPLDGSLNYSKGIPFYTSSIALWENGRPLLGYIFDYSHKAFYLSQKGLGAKVNGKKISVSSPDSHLIKATGIPSFTAIESGLDLFKESLANYMKLRWLGCASLSLCYVAEGKIDAYEERGIKLWDVAAGISMVLEAGGKVEMNFNQDGTLNLLASNGFIA